MKKTLLFLLLGIILASSNVLAQYQYDKVVDGGAVEINQWIVTGEFGTREEWSYLPDYIAYDTFYVANPNRTSGVRVLSYFLAGDTFMVYVEGYMVTLENGERAIQPIIDSYYGPHIAGESGYALPKPFGVSQKALTAGLTPKGARIRVWGKVVKEITDAPDNEFDYYYIDDGSHLTTDQPDVKGLKVLLHAWTDDPIHLLGEQVVITGVLSQEKLPDGTIIPVLFRTNDLYDDKGPRGPEKYVVSGTVTAPEAAGRKAKIIADTGEQTQCNLDMNGVGSFSVTIPGGENVTSCIVPGYTTQVMAGYLDQNYTDINFEPYWTYRYMQLSPSNGQVNLSDSKTITAWCRDAEAKSMPNMPITWRTDFSTITNAQTVTDENGEATATLVAGQNKGVATLWAESPDATGGAWVQISNPNDPSIRLLSPRYHTTISGVVELDIWFDDPLDQGQVNLKKMRLLVDGQPFSPCYATHTDQWGEKKHANFNTIRVTNGDHNIVVEAEMRSGAIMRSNVVPVNVQNRVSALTISNKTIVIDQPDKSVCQVGAQMTESLPWTIKILDADDNTVYSTSGNGPGLMSCSWDGKIDGQPKTGVFQVAFEINDGSIAANSESSEEIGDFFSVTRSFGGNRALVAGVLEGDGWLLRKSAAREMDAFGRACENKGIRVDYVFDPTWTRDGDYTQPMGFKDLIATRYYRYLYLTTHGGSDLCTDGHYRTTIMFADGVGVMGSNMWVAPAQRHIWPAFTDAYLPENSFYFSQLNVCFSGGCEQEEDQSFAVALGCRNDEQGSTYIGWRGEYKPLGGPFGLPIIGGLAPNGEGWSKDCWYYLGDKTHTWSVAQAISKADSDATWDLRVRNWMFLYRYVNTDYSALVTWLVN
ncbi:MAG: Ig-like domain-containing protein [Patescibacteria group bacterium]